MSDDDLIRRGDALQLVEDYETIHDRISLLPAALAPTDAAQAPAEDAHVKGETAGQMLERLGMDGVKWAAEFRTTALRLGYSDMDEGWLIGWFCNAIMAGYDRSAAQAREAALIEAAAAWEAFKAATTSADHFAAVDRLDAVLIGEARPRSANRVDYNPDGTLDEIVTDAGVHLEHMGGKRWFLGASRSDGTEIRVWFDGKVTLIEDDAKEART